MKLLVPFFFFLYSAASAQVTTKTSNQITRSGAGWKLEGNKLNWSELKAELYKAPKAIPYVQKASTQRVIGILGFVSGIAFSVLGQTNDDTYPYKNNNGLKIAGIVSLSAGITFTIISKKNIRKAVRMYNKNRGSVY
jgi:hypothetical protein